MQYFLIFLFLTTCANSKQETPAAVQPPPAQEAPTNVPTALGDEDLEAQIAKDFEPYLKYFSREKLYPYTLIKNGFVLSDAEKTTNFIKFKNSGAVLAYTNQYGIVFHNTHGIFITPDEWDTLSRPQSFSYSYNHIFDNLTNEDIYEAFTELVLKEFPFDPPHNIFHSKTAELLNIPSTFTSQMGLSFYLELTIERIAKLSGIPDKDLYILFGLDKSARTPSEQAQRAFYLFTILCGDVSINSLRAFILNRMASMVYLDNDAETPQISFPPLRWED